MVANRVALELANIHPRPPAVRVFDAGVGDGTVMLRVLRAMHDRFPHMPFYVVGKEISLEDVRLALQKMSDRFCEHPATVLVLTNLAYADAPWLAVKSLNAASSLVWHEVPLVGNSAHRFEQQITDLVPFLSQNWKAGVSAKTGNPVYERPVVLVIYREDHKFLLDPIIPRPGGTVANYDLVIASQPYRARASLDFKAKRVIAPLPRALGPGGRLIAIHSHGNDPGMEIIQQVWPGDNPFIHDRHQILKAVKQELGPAGRDLNFNAYADNRSLFRYDMHTLPSEISESIGTSTLFAAWNAAIYVAQVEDDRLGDVVSDGRYLDATRDVLQDRGGLWFYDEFLRDLAQARVTPTDARASPGHAAAGNDHGRTDTVAGDRRLHARILDRGDAAIRGGGRGARRASRRPARASISAQCRRGRRRKQSNMITAARAGFEPVPHVAVRMFARPPRSTTSWPRFAGEAGVERLLVIAGDREQPAGDLRSAIEVIDGGLLQRRGISEIGIAGYPEGHPRLSQQELDRALTDKIAAAEETGIKAHIVTQFCFDAAADPALDRAAARFRPRASGAHRACRPDQSRRRCCAMPALRRAGLGAGAGAAGRPRAASLRHVGARRLVRALAQARAEGQLGAVKPHFFAFGGLSRRRAGRRPSRSAASRSMAGPRISSRTVSQMG